MSTSERPAHVLTSLPLVPLRDVVMYPKMVIPLFVGRPKSIRALEYAMSNSKQVLLLTQKQATSELETEQKSPLSSNDASGATDEKNSPEQTLPEMFEIGCTGNLLQMLKLPDGTVKVLIEGLQRVFVSDIELNEEHDIYFAQITTQASEEVSDQNKPSAKSSKNLALQSGLRRVVIERFETYTRLSRRIPPEIMASIAGLDDLGRMTDTISSHIPFKLPQKQAILEAFDLSNRMKLLLAQLEAEIDILNIDKKIRGQIKKSLDKHQRDYYLREQAQAIQKELSDPDDDSDAASLERKIKQAKIPKEAEKKALKELSKLKLMPASSAESSVIRSYIDVLIGLPWSKKTKIKRDLALASQILNEDHFGLDKVKERILEYLAVQQRVERLKAPILCLVGPPGVGKTSLGQSIAKATGRTFVRMALGGMRDEAEIRGHRRTYIGALPGRVLQNLKKIETRNPLFLLDEIDKIGADFRGDPSSALLEVLDPEQNHTFNDHYIELDFDLSEVMFVATSNTLNISPALLDRMEVIRLSGYTEEEKINIATRHLLPKQLKNNGLKPEELKITEEAVRDIIRYYTREAGVRNLERCLSQLCRKVVKGILLKTCDANVAIDSDQLLTFLGVRQFTFGRAEKQNQIGQVVGLAWTEVGGDLLNIEAAVMPGKGNVLRTGSLGEVMKESVEAARSVVRSRAKFWGIADDVFERHDIHVHVPDGGTPKDGPSAGAAIATAIISALSGIPAYAHVAMTGEITLRGEITAIGGLKEKLLAAMRGGITTVLIPEDNIKDLANIPEQVKNKLKIMPVRWIDHVLEIALERVPQPQLNADLTLSASLLANADPLLKTSAATLLPTSPTKH